jgi:hypothetical protein
MIARPPGPTSAPAILPRTRRESATHEGLGAAEPPAGDDRIPGATGSRDRAGRPELRQAPPGYHSRPRWHSDDGVQRASRVVAQNPLSSGVAAMGPAESYLLSGSWAWRTTPPETYLSDRGHFEPRHLRVGAAPLPVHRRLRREHGPGFGSRTSAWCIRKCQVDLGVRSRSTPGRSGRSATQRSLVHCAVGTIRLQRGKRGRQHARGGRLSPPHQTLRHRGGPATSKYRPLRRVSLHGARPTSGSVSPSSRATGSSAITHASCSTAQASPAPRRAQPTAPGESDVRGPEGTLVSVERRDQGRLEARRPPERSRWRCAGTTISASRTPRSTQWGEP